MKKFLILSGMLVCVLTFGMKTVYAQVPPPVIIIPPVIVPPTGPPIPPPTAALNDTVRNLASLLSADIGIANRIAVVAIHSSSARMSDHLVNEMNMAFLGQGFIVDGRNRVDMALQGRGLQSSSLINEVAAQAIGHDLGSQFVITGAFEPLHEFDFFQFTATITEVETGTRRSYAGNVRNTAHISSLMDERRLSERPHLPSIGFGLMFDWGRLGTLEGPIPEGTLTADFNTTGFGAWLWYDFGITIMTIGFYGGSINLNESVTGLGSESGRDGSFFIADFNLLFRSRTAFFPLVGAGLALGTFSNSTLNYIAPQTAGGGNDSFASFRLLFGLGGDVGLSEHWFLRTKVLGSYRFASSSHSNIADRNPGISSSGGFGVTAMIGFGFRG